LILRNKRLPNFRETVATMLHYFRQLVSLQTFFELWRARAKKFLRVSH